MSHPLPSPLPTFDRTLLRTAARLVPLAERPDYCRTWEAELWHLHHGTRRKPTLSRILALQIDLSIGLTRDALWLRTESWRRTYSGTATLCLASLLTLCLISTGIAIFVTGGWHALRLCFADQLTRSLIGAPLVVFVTCATASRRHLQQTSAGIRLYWLKRQLFFAAKTTLILTLTFLLSADLCHPLHATLPNTADLFQILSFVLLALIGMRWAFHDQEQRCKQCLHALATPARVGRPSHNLLEWNGTELLCKQGHGLLSVPEIETSWCQSSQWITQPAP